MITNNVFSEVFNGKSDHSINLISEFCAFSEFCFNNFENVAFKNIVQKFKFFLFLNIYIFIILINIENILKLLVKK